MKSWILVGILGAISLAFHFIEELLPKRYLYTFIIRTLFAISSIALTVACWAASKEEVEIAAKIFIVILTIGTAFVSFLSILQVLFALYDLIKKPKNLDRIEDITKRLKALKKQCSDFYSKDVGIDNVIKEISSFSEKCKNITHFTESTKQLFSYFLPEYEKIYSGFVKYVVKNYYDKVKISEYAAKMTESSFKFLDFIKDARKEQESMENTETVDFQLETKKFNEMLDTQNCSGVLLLDVDSSNEDLKTIDET
jgi:hypothetical protein